MMHAIASAVNGNQSEGFSIGWEAGVRAPHHDIVSYTVVRTEGDNFNSAHAMGFQANGRAL